MSIRHFWKNLWNGGGGVTNFTRLWSSGYSTAIKASVKSNKSKMSTQFVWHLPTVLIRMLTSDFHFGSWNVAWLCQKNAITLKIGVKKKKQWSQAMRQKSINKGRRFLKGSLGRGLDKNPKIWGEGLDRVWGKDLEKNPKSVSFPTVFW